MYVYSRFSRPSTWISKWLDLSSKWLDSGVVFWMTLLQNPHQNDPELPGPTCVLSAITLSWTSSVIPWAVCRCLSSDAAWNDLWRQLLISHTHNSNWVWFLCSWSFQVSFVQGGELGVLDPQPEKVQKYFPGVTYFTISTTHSMIEVQESHASALTCFVGVSICITMSIGPFLSLKNKRLGRVLAIDGFVLGWRGYNNHFSEAGFSHYLFTHG